jgi:hypothetical protein
LLALDVPASTPLSLPPEGLAALEPALRQPTGFASSEARRHGGQQTPQREGNAHTRDTMVRPWFTTQRQGPRPRHTHTPGRHGCGAGHLARAVAARPPRRESPPGARYPAGWSSPARLRGVLRLWRRGADPRGMLLAGVALPRCGHRPTLSGRLCASLSRRPDHPAPGQPWGPCGPAPDQSSERALGVLPTLQSGAPPARGAGAT